MLTFYGGCTMKKYLGLFKNSFTILSIVFFSMLFSSCARNRVVSIPVPTDLLSKSCITQPIVENAILITVCENTKIRPVYKLEESLKAALQSTLNYSNIFGHDSSRPFEIVFDILEWNQTSVDCGKIFSTMRTHYILFDEDKNIIFDGEITTEACSDRWFSAGVKRSSRSATVNVAKNVNQFVDILKSKFGLSSSSTVKGRMYDSDKHQFLNRKNEITNKLSLSKELKNLSELHSSGFLTDQEFQKAKEKLLNER